MMIDKMKAAFDEQVGLLKKINPRFQGEVLLKAGLLIIGTFDKNSASIIRLAMKKVKNLDCGTLTEVRGNNGTAFVWVDDSLVMTKREIRQIALAA